MDRVSTIQHTEDDPISGMPALVVTDTPISNPTVWVHELDLDQDPVNVTELFWVVAPWLITVCVAIVDSSRLMMVGFLMSYVMSSIMYLFTGLLATYIVFDPVK
eukprot:GHVU01135477.1.p4 GENE.GHVU01135477.1~~GHVU01135477.1.p4  ORF type:complete len:104 (-),score=7.30 GHVU01135477.1:475-786(-)